MHISAKVLKPMATAQDISRAFDDGHNVIILPGGDESAVFVHAELADALSKLPGWSPPTEGPDAYSFFAPGSPMQIIEKLRHVFIDPRPEILHPDAVLA